MKMRTLTLIALFGSAIAPVSVMAADNTQPAADSGRPGMTANSPTMDRKARKAQWMQSKDQLEQALGTGKDKAHYRQTLEKMGYHITAVNSDDPDYLEYEVIKGGDSYEVQVDFSNGISKEVDVTTNVWKADATRAALKNKDYRYTYPTALTPNSKDVSDRVRGKAWAGEKDAIEKQLGVGHDRAYYRTAFEKMGYKVTSVNDNEADNLEMEVVKGDTSYEVEVDFDEKTRKSTSVDVSTNMWETESTERAKGEE